jgi:hypothetical protein
MDLLLRLRLIVSNEVYAFIGSRDRDVGLVLARFVLRLDPRYFAGSLGYDSTNYLGVLCGNMLVRLDDPQQND